MNFCTALVTVVIEQVIVAASFFCNFIVDGIAYSGSQYVMAWKAEFPDADESTISLIPSLLNGVYLLMGTLFHSYNPGSRQPSGQVHVSQIFPIVYVGPISSALTNAFGFRVIIVSGAIIACVAFIISMFASSILYLNLSFGVLGGELCLLTNNKRLSGTIMGSHKRSLFLRHRFWTDIHTCYSLCMLLL